MQNQIVPGSRYVCQYVLCMMNTTASFKTKAQLHNCVTLILAHTTEFRPGPFSPADAIFVSFRQASLEKEVLLIEPVHWENTKWTKL